MPDRQCFTLQANRVLKTPGIKVHPGHGPLCAMDALRAIAPSGYAHSPSYGRKHLVLGGIVRLEDACFFLPGVFNTRTPKLFSRHQVIPDKV
jgi:hypothetical protein